MKIYLLSQKYLHRLRRTFHRGFVPVIQHPNSDLDKILKKSNWNSNLLFIIDSTAIFCGWVWWSTPAKLQMNLTMTAKPSRQGCNCKALTHELVYFKSEWPASAQLGLSHSFTYGVRCWLVKSLPIKEALVNVTWCIACSCCGNSFGASTEVFAAAEDYNSSLTAPRKVSKRKNATRNTINCVSLLVYPTNIFS